VFNVQGLVTNGISVGGLSTLSFDAAYRDVVRSTSDGALGVEDVDRAGLRVGVSLECTDVAKVNQILAAAASSTTFYAKEAGATTWHKYEILLADAALLWTGMRLRMAKAADAVLSLTGVMRFADGTKNIDNAITLTAAVATAPTLTYPARLYRPNTASFDPDGADPAIAPLHLESLDLSLDAQVIEDYSDTDLGHTAVDIVGWNPLEVSLTHKDASDPGADASDMTAKILKAVRGVLTATLLGRGGAANKALTINNLLFTGARPTHRAEYSEFGMSGSCGWKNGATVYALDSGTRLFQIA
jgi:hypothetical protein